MPKFKTDPATCLEFFVTCIEMNLQNYPKTREIPQKIKDATSLEHKLYIQSEYLKIVEIEKARAGYAIGTFYHQQHQKFTDAERNIVESAKLKMFNQALAERPKYHTIIKKFLAGLSSEAINNMTLQEMNLHTDDAFAGYESPTVLKNISLEKFYESTLENHREFCNKQIQYAVLFPLADHITLVKNLSQDEKDLTLRKLVVTDPSPIVVRELLAAGANPLAVALNSGMNAIDRAKQYGLTEILVLLEKQDSTSTLESVGMKF